MDFKRFAAKKVVVWLVIGLIGGGIAGDLWERQRSAQDLAEVKVQQAERLKDAQAKIDRLMKDLDAERHRRETLEGVLADLRKGS